MTTYERLDESYLKWRGMHVSQMNFKKGLIASVAVFFATLAWPIVYDRFGEGAQLTRELVLKSEILRAECGAATRFYIVPWGLGLEETDAQVTLEIAYWFRCADRWARVDARYEHQGKGWVPSQLVVVDQGRTLQLAP
jgi:hypothetical protein